MRVLATGGAGFIGSTIVRRLVDRGAEVIVLDDLSRGSLASLPAGIDVVEHDISTADTPRRVAETRPTHVLHTAAQISVERSMSDAVHDRAVNLDGTRHVLEGARRCGAKRFVFVSSGGAVYGEAAGATEAHVPAPRSYYGVHKLAAEGYVAMAGLSYAVARPSNVYGPGQRDDLEGGVVAIFARAVATGQPVTLHGDGEQQRDFVHVEDVADALGRMLDSDRLGVWNVATGSPTSINQLLATVESAMRRTVERRSAPPRTGDVRQSWLSVAAIASDLGWTPRVSLADGVRGLLAAS